MALKVNLFCCRPLTLVSCTTAYNVYEDVLVNNNSIFSFRQKNAALNCIPLSVRRGCSNCCIIYIIFTAHITTPTVTENVGNRLDCFMGINWLKSFERKISTFNRPINFNNVCFGSNTKIKVILFSPVAVLGCQTYY